MEEFKFYYLINDKFVDDEDVRRSIAKMKYREKEYFERWGKVLDKSKIPSGKYCNNEVFCCPYCVCDDCLLFGASMESKLGLYGFSFQKRKTRCIEKFPKGKDARQLSFSDAMEGGDE